MTAPSPGSVDLVPCPEHPGYACRSIACGIQPLDFGLNASFETAWNSAIPPLWEPAAWTLNWSTTALDATLNVTTYHAFNYGPGDPLYGSLYAGARLQIDWCPTADQEGLKWIQAVHTNRPRQVGPQWYLDLSNTAPERPPVYPYSYPDHHFYDNPSRRCEPDQQVFWEAWLYLASVDPANKSVVVYEGVSWGFNIDCLPVPEPTGLVVLCTGAAVVLIRGRAGALCRWRR